MKRGVRSAMSRPLLERASALHDLMKLWRRLQADIDLRVSPLSSPRVRYSPAGCTENPTLHAKVGGLARPRARVATP
jgi:hypothetical protein